MPLFKSLRSRNRKSELSDVGSVTSRRSTSSNNNESTPVNAQDTSEAKTDFGPSSYKSPFIGRRTSKGSAGPPSAAPAGMISPSSDNTPASPGAIERSKSRSFFGGNQPRRQSSSASNRTRPVFGRKGSSTQATGLPAIDRVASPGTEELDPLAAEAAAAAAAAAQPPPGARPSDLFGKGMAWGEVDPSGGPTKTPQQTEDLQKFLRERRQWVPTFVTEETPEVDVKPVTKPNDIAFSSTLPESASLMSLKDLDEMHNRKQLLLDESFPAAENWTALGGSSAAGGVARGVTNSLPTTSGSTSTITGPTVTIPPTSGNKPAPLTLHPSSGGVDAESPTTPRKSTTIARKPVPSADTSLPSTPAAPRRSSEIPVYPTSPPRHNGSSSNGPVANGRQVDSFPDTNGSALDTPQEASKSVASPALGTPSGLGAPEEGRAGILPMAPSPALPSSNADTPDPSARLANDDESAQPFEVPSTASTNTIHADSLAGAAPSPMTGEPGGDSIDSISRGSPSVIASVGESGAGQGFETPDASLPASEAGHSGAFRADEHGSGAALPLSSSSHGLGRLVNDDNAEEGTAPASAEPSGTQSGLLDESKEELVDSNLSPEAAGKAGGIPPHLLRTQSQMTPLALGADEGSPFPGGMAASVQK